MTTQNIENTTIRVGVSSCLLGERVRYDGCHKLDELVAGTLSRWFELVPVCPEVAIGLGVPREPIQLVAETGEQPKAIGVHTPTLDATAALQRYARSVAPELSGLCGYIFKSGSPSCGIRSVVIHSSAGSPAAEGSGIFARVLMQRFPSLPVEEEWRLRDPLLRKRFIEHVLAYHRRQQLKPSD